MLDVYHYVVDTVMKKNADYGDAWQIMGTITPAVRLIDKAGRLITLDKPGSCLQVSESIEDTLMDVVGYCILALMYKHNNDGKKQGIYGLPHVVVTPEGMYAERHGILNVLMKMDGVARIPGERSRRMMELAKSLLYVETLDGAIWAGETELYTINMQLMANLALHMLDYMVPDTRRLYDKA